MTTNTCCGECRYWQSIEPAGTSHAEAINSCCLGPDKIERGEHDTACRHFAARKQGRMVELREKARVVEPAR